MTADHTDGGALPSLEVLDVDGAIRDSFEKTGGDTRAVFLKKALVGGTALAGSGALMGAMPGIAGAAQSTRGGSVKRDIAILNFALTLEYLESTFYARSVKSGALTGELATFAKVVSAHESAHVAAIKATIKKLGGTPVHSPKFNFRGATSDKVKFAETAMALEDTGVKAYSGQVNRVYLGPVLAAATSILTVEARHASWIRNINRDAPAPRDFDIAWSQKQVLAAVKATGFIVG